MDIRIDNLTVLYDGHSVLANVSFDVRSGQKFCILGPSGCGKSTILRAILGLIRPRHGNIFLDGRPVNETTVWQHRTQIAYVAQEPNPGQQGVLDWLRQPFEYKANAHLQWQQKTVDALLDRFKLPRKLLDKQTSDLSGGEKQRMAIISSLLLDRPVMLLDEPASALDKESKQILKDLLAGLNKTIVFISHEGQLLEIADAVFDLYPAGGQP